MTSSEAAKTWLTAAEVADRQAERFQECVQKAKAGDRPHFRAKAEACTELAEKYRRQAYYAKQEPCPACTRGEFPHRNCVMR